ncbi:unnamed protein product [Ceutorhynchus assimilis]|uniref:Kinesin-like protein n=1 Tax=Ceutorhynchus assimilis TaxID=467358 RepID=A0A9N9QJZ5_9CUCU|nr:unnamed protein product [Ceutorhynchus assimilis]
MDIKKEHINVCIRIRPVLAQDNTASSSLQIISKEPPMLLVKERNQIFNFDHVFPDCSDQEKVYLDAVEPLVNCIKLGYNGTVFAYGQTGTGKTYTMGSGSQKSEDNTKEGIIPRALKQLFTDNNDNEEIQVRVTFCEIYNEKVFDLLTLNKTPLPVSGFTAPNLIKKCVINVTEANNLLEWGNKNRHVGQTKQNSNSSRSHAIFTVEYENRIQNTTSKLNLVDLAGSESAKKNGTKGRTFQEGININKGLLTLGQVIKALSIKSSYIPYRESMITTILHDSLKSENFISLISCVSANPEDVLDTMQTLDFAQKAKRIKSNPTVNAIVDKFNKENTFAKTPMKRATPLKASTAKKMVMPLSVIDESNDQFSIASTSSSIITREVLSPFMKKFVAEIENRMVNHLNTALKNATPHPVLSSSTPIEDKPVVAQRLVYSPENNDDDVFKIPQIRKVSQIISMSPTPRRRSVRLSIKRQNSDGNETLNSRSPIISMSPAPRRSLRLSSIIKTSFIAETKPEPKIIRKRKAQTSCCHTPSPPKMRKHASRVLLERALKNDIEQKQNSPFTNHSKGVLHVLNFGNKHEIEKLHFVGSKTAEQVLLYRKLKGRFACIEDLRTILGPKRYQTFVQKNFLKKD